MHVSFMTPPSLSPIVAGAWRMADWNWTPQERLRWIEQCLDLGITSFDHADIYGGYTVEALFGQALALSPGLRQRMQIISKCGIKLVHPGRPAHHVKSYDTSRAHVVASVDNSLRELGTDHLDLLLIHRPDALMDPRELADTFESLKRQGKVRSFGVSNHSTSQFDLLQRHHPLVTNQIELSVLQMKALSDGTLDQCVELGIRPMAWSPLGGGRLFTAQDEQAVRVRAVLQQLAGEYGVQPSTMALAWLMRHPSRPIPITGSHRPQALQEAVAALGVQLSAEHWYALWQASMGHAVP